jgi:hypothetical protein
MRSTWVGLQADAFLSLKRVLRFGCGLAMRQKRSWSVPEDLARPRDAAAPLR